MAGPPSPRSPKAQSVGGDAPLSLFLDTDLGTRLALLAAPDTTITRLKSQVAAEHVELFPDIGPVDVKSFQVRQKGALYHLSETMTVMSAFTRVKCGCFLHVKMAEVCCCHGAPEIDGRRTTEGHVGSHVNKHAKELPTAIPKVANDDLTHRREVPDDVLLAPSSQLDTEMKNEAEGLAVDANIDKSSKQTNISHAVAADINEYVLHGAQDHDDGDGGSENKHIRIEENMLGQIHAADGISQGKKHKKTKRADSVHMSAKDPRITDDNIPGDSLCLENPSTVGKKKKRKMHQLAASEAVSGQETTNLPTGTVRLSKSGANLTNRDGSKARSPDLLLSSEPNDENQRGKHVQFGNNAQTSTDLISERTNFDHVHNGDRNPSLGNSIDFTDEAPASGEKNAEGSNDPRDGDGKHEEIKQHKYNEGGHDGGVAETSNMEKEKCKKVKKVNSVEMTSKDTAADKEILRHTENAGKSNKVDTEREILHGPSVGPISDNVQQGDSNVIGNPNCHRKRKKKRRRQSESVENADPNQGQTKSSQHVTNGSSIQHTISAPPDAQQITQGSVVATATSHNKFGESLDIAAASMIDEVLAALKSRESIGKDLSEDLLTEQIHLDSNPKSLEHPASADNEVGNYAALPPKYPEGIHSDAPLRSPSHKKPKGKKLKVVPTMIDSSHHSRGMTEENANKELKESDTLRFSGKASDLKDVSTEDVVAQDDDKAKSAKLKRKKVPSDNGKTAQPLVEQVNQVAIQADLIQGDSVIDTPMETVGKVQQKGKRSSKIRAPKIQETNHSTHTIKGSQDANAISITGTHDSENTSGYPTESPVVQKDTATLKSSSPNAGKEREKVLRTELHSQVSATEQDPNADLVHCSAEKGLVSPKNSAVAVEPNHCTVAHPASDKINFFDHFSSVDINAQLVSAETIQNNEDEGMEVKNKNNNTDITEANDLLEFPTEKTSLTDHFGASELVPSAKTENMGREYDTVKSGKVKRIRKRKPNSEGPAADKERLDGDHRGTSIGTRDSLHSAVQKGRMEQDSGNNNNKGTQNSSIQQEPEDVTFDRTVEKKLHQGDIDSQNNLPINNDNANVRKELRSPISPKPHAKSTKQDVSNIVKSFAFSPGPAASSDTEGTPQLANRYRVAVRKVSRKSYEQAHVKSKNESRKLGFGAIFNDAISDEFDDEMDTRGEKAPSESSSDSSTTSAGSVCDESDLPDDDGGLSLSQKSLRGLHIGSILRGSSSYKKAKQKHAELLDDDAEVPDSQPADDMWG